MLIVAAVIAGWLVSADALNFPIVQMTIAVLILVLVVIAPGFWRPFDGKKSTPRSKKSEG